MATIQNKYNLTGNSYYFFPGTLARTHETDSNIVIPGNRIVLFSGTMPETDVAYEYKNLDEIKAAYSDNVIFEWTFDLSYKYYRDEKLRTIIDPLKDAIPFNHENDGAITWFAVHLVERDTVEWADSEGNLLSEWQPGAVYAAYEADGVTRAPDNDGKASYLIIDDDANVIETTDELEANYPDLFPNTFPKFHPYKISADGTTEYTYGDADYDAADNVENSIVIVSDKINTWGHEEAIVIVESMTLAQRSEDAIAENDDPSISDSEFRNILKDFTFELQDALPVYYS